MTHQSRFFPPFCLALSLAFLLCPGLQAQSAVVTDGSGAFATGHYRNGVLLTPVTADVVEELVLHDRLLEVARPFALERFGPVTAQAVRG